MTQWYFRGYFHIQSFQKVWRVKLWFLAWGLIIMCWCGDVACCHGNSLAVSVCGLVVVNRNSSLINGLHGVVPMLRHELKTIKQPFIQHQSDATCFLFIYLLFKAYTL